MMFSTVITLFTMVSANGFQPTLELKKCVEENSCSYAEYIGIWDVLPSNPKFLSKCISLSYWVIPNMVQNEMSFTECCTSFSDQQTTQIEMTGTLRQIGFLNYYRLAIIKREGLNHPTNSLDVQSNAATLRAGITHLWKRKNDGVVVAASVYHPLLHDNSGRQRTLWVKRGSRLSDDEMNRINLSQRLLL